MIYAILCELTFNPMRFISMVFVLFVTLYAYLLRIYEQPYFAALSKDDGNFEEMNSYLTALWLVIITVTTVGYGDYSAGTLPGRIITIMIAIKGIFLMAVVVGVVSEKFQLDSTGKMAVVHHKVTIEARNVIVRSIQFFRAKKRYYVQSEEKKDSKFMTLLREA